VAKDTFFFEEKENLFYRRKGGNKVEQIYSFRILQKNEDRIPTLTCRLVPRATVDQMYVLFEFYDTGPRAIFTARRLRKDGTFLPPNPGNRYIVQADTEGLLPRKTKKKRPP
jgi:hypothetical protein